MANAFDAGLRALFSDPHGSLPAIYHPQSGADITGIRAIFRRPDEVFEGVGTGAYQPARIAEVLAADVPNATKGDTITIDGTLYSVIRQPTQPDNDRRKWRLELAPA